MLATDYATSIQVRKRNNIFWTLLRAHFNPRLMAKVKMSPSPDLKHIYARNYCKGMDYLYLILFTVFLSLIYSQRDND